MKEVKAIIQPFMLSKVLDALHAMEGFPGATASEVQGVGARGEFSYERHTRVKLEIIVSDAMADTIAQAIRENGRTGNPGDGHVFVIPVERAIRIRTGDDVGEQ